jgi:hypothetical protein
MTSEPRFVARVIGVDPGKMSGICVADLEYRGSAGLRDKALFGDFTINIVAIMSVHEDKFVPAWRVLVNDLYVMDPGAPIVVVNEHFVVTRKSMQTQDIQPLKITGAIRAVMEVLEIPYTYYTQLPSEAKLFINNARLKALTNFDTKIDDHAEDAVRHVLTWCSKYVHSKVEFPKTEDQEKNDQETV